MAKRRTLISRVTMVRFLIYRTCFLCVLAHPAISQASEIFHVDISNKEMKRAISAYVPQRAEVTNNHVGSR